MSRPVFLYERIALAARTAGGPPIVPSTTNNTPSRFKAEERMVVDYFFMDLEGVALSQVIQPQDITVLIEDQKGQKWMDRDVQLINLNNVARGRSDTITVYGDWLQQNILAAGNWIIPSGTYNMFIDNVLLTLQRNAGAGWAGVLGPSGAVQSDGTNVRVLNTDGANAHNVFYQRIDSVDAGEWWLPKPFRLERQHGLTLNIENRQASPTKFIVTFHAFGEFTRRPYVLEQEVDLAAATTRPFSSIGLDVNSEEAIIIQSMTFCKHPDYTNSDPIPLVYQFDSRRIDMQIAPSQGAIWSEYRVPLVAYSNIRGRQVSCFFKPLRGLILEQNDFYYFTLYNHSAAARNCHVAVAGHTLDADEEEMLKK